MARPFIDTETVSPMGSPRQPPHRTANGGPFGSPSPGSAGPFNHHPDPNGPFTVSPQLGPSASPTGSPTGSAFRSGSPTLGPSKLSAPGQSSLFNLLWVPPSPNDGKFPSPSSAGRSPPSASSRTTVNGGSLPAAHMIAPALPNSPSGVGGPAGMGIVDDLHSAGLPPPVPGSVTAFGVWPTAGPSSAAATDVYRGDPRGAVSLPSLSYVDADTVPPSSTFGQANYGFDAHRGGVGAGPQFYLPRPSMSAYRYSSSGSSAGFDDPIYRSGSTYSSGSSLAAYPADPQQHQQARGHSYYSGSPSASSTDMFQQPQAAASVMPARPGLAPYHSNSNGGSITGSSEGSRFSALSLGSDQTRTTTSASSGGSCEADRYLRRPAGLDPSASSRTGPPPSGHSTRPSHGRSASLPHHPLARAASSLPAIADAQSSSSSGVTTTGRDRPRQRANGGPASLTGLPAGEPSTVTALGYKRKHACTWPTCGKAFTTSGHLARHMRIHTGEKRYECLMPGCGSRFSRQDNMLQHYRTHLSGKSRRVSSLSLPIEPEHAAAARARLQAQQARLDAAAAAASSALSDDGSSVSGGGPSIAGSSGGGGAIGVRKSSGGGGGGRGVGGRPPAYAWEGKMYGLVLDESDIEPGLMEPLSLDSDGGGRQHKVRAAPVAADEGYDPTMATAAPGPAAQIHIHHHYTHHDEIMGPPAPPSHARSTAMENPPPPVPMSTRPSRPSFVGGFPNRTTWHAQSPSSSGGGAKSGSEDERKDGSVMVGGVSLASYRAALAGHHLHEKTVALSRQRSTGGV